MAIDRQALIEVARRGFATPLCTDHGSAYHPGYEPDASCPEFNPAAANKLLDDNGWVKGPDGVRARGGQRLEFEFSTDTTLHGVVMRSDRAAQLGGDWYQARHPELSSPHFFNPFLLEGKASPPTGAVAGRYDIAELRNNFGMIPTILRVACDQIPPHGYNVDFYCNPALDALYKQEQATADPGVRQNIFQQIHQIYLTEFPFHHALQRAYCYGAQGDAQLPDQPL